MSGINLVYETLKKDSVIKSYLESAKDGLKIKFYEYPETADYEGSYMIIDPLINGMPSSYSDKTWVTYDYLVHIDIFSRNYNDSLTLADRVRDVLWDKLGFKQNDMTSEYDTGIYREARRYTGSLHKK